jgi:hypothetical protein
MGSSIFYNMLAPATAEQQTAVSLHSYQHPRNSFIFPAQ